MYLFLRHSQKRLDPNRADLAFVQQVQEVTQGNPDFRGQILRAMEYL